MFSTFTYNRSLLLNDAWTRSSKDFNRVIQKFRRLHNADIQYLRVLEAHKDGYPHIHCILQFPDARLRINNSRFFDRRLYSRWKSLWTHGHSDYQRPRKRSANAVLYVLKYLLKNTTRKTILKKIHPPYSSDFKPTLAEQARVRPMTNLPIKKYGVKLATWSRGFDFTPFQILAPSYSPSDSNL